MFFKESIEKNKKIILENLKNLLKINSEYDESTVTSEMPFGKGINDSLKYMESLAIADGFDVFNADGYALEISYGQAKKTIGILAHLDVVPSGEGWMYPPYSATLVDNKIYARGAIDDKGPLLAAYYALKLIKDANIPLKKEVKLILGTDEETSWKGVDYYFNTLKKKMPEIGFSPDASFPLVYGEKGRIALDFKINDMSSCAYKNDCLISFSGGNRYNVVIEKAEMLLKIDVTTDFLDFISQSNLQGDVKYDGQNYQYILYGKSAHAMEPEKGINAGTYLAMFASKYTNNPLVNFIAKYNHLDYNLKKFDFYFTDKEMGLATLNIGIINIAKDISRMTYDIRFPNNFDYESFMKKIKCYATENGLLITKSSIKMPHYVSPNSELVTKLYEAYVKNTGDLVNKPFTIGGGTYASMINGAVAFGMEMPGEDELAHQKNEYLDLDIFYKTIQIYIDAILSLGENE